MVHYQEGSDVHRNFVFLIFSKGGYKVPTVHHFTVSLFSLKAFVYQTTRALSLPLSVINTFAYKICRTKRLMQGSGLMSIQTQNHKTTDTIYLSLYYLFFFYRVTKITLVTFVWA